MDIITTPLPPDVEYTLDAALEHFEISAATHVALKLYAPRIDLIQIVDREWSLGSVQDLRSRLAMCGRLNDLADDIISRLQEDTRAAINLADCEHIRSEVHRSAWSLATWAIEDTIKGGCLEPYKRNMSAINRRYELSRRQYRKLYGRDWIRRYIKTNEEARSLRIKGRRAIDRLGSRLPSSDEVRSAAEHITTMLRVQHEGYRRTNERNLRQYVESQRRGLETTRRDTRRQRRIIKRAHRTAAAVLSASNLSDFAAGRSIFLNGQSLALEVARLGSSASMGHGVLSVTAVDLDTRERLASLCVYHERTPALDQLTALAMAMQAGEEADIIATANLSRVTTLGLAHPLIAERGREHMEAPWRPRDETAEKNEAYWVATKPVWIETLGINTLGRIWGTL